MKKTYLTLGLIFVLAAGVSAQKGLNVGVEGALNGTFIVYQQTYGKPELDYASTINNAEGIVIGYNLNRHFGFQVEGVYAKQGQNYTKVSANAPTITRQVNLYYDHVPILFKYSSGGDNPARFFVLVGPQLSILDKASIYYKDGTTEYTIDAKNRFVASTWDVVFELGCEFKIFKALYASAGLRLNYGLDDINDPNFRMPNHNGVYYPSKNAYGGINIGLHYVLTHNK